MPTHFEIDDSFISEHNQKTNDWVEEDYEHLSKKLRRQNVDIEDLVAKAQGFRVAIPSWGVGTGGTRFARFPAAGEPRDIYEKLEDCATIFKLVCSTPAVSHPAQDLSYKFGSLTHPDKAVRRQAIEHNIECIEIGKALGSTAHTVWIGDGGNFPGQQHFRRALERYLESMREIYAALPDDWRVFIEHKFYEPAFYSTVINDWGTSYYCARELGSKAFCLVDLGHHAPNVNIEMIVARLIQFGKLAGFHFNDSKYGDDDLDSGSVKPFQLFLIFNELVDAELNQEPYFNPAYMLDQSHNVTDPIESLMMSAAELVRAYVQAHLVDRQELSDAQEKCDPLRALATLKQAFTTDVAPILAVARARAGGAIDPIRTFRESGYRQRKAEERPVRKGTAASGIV